MRHNLRHNLIRNKKLVLLLVLPILLVLWMGVVAIDYTLSTKAYSPMFARGIAANDAEIYRGLGYTVIVDDGYAISPPDAEVKVYFYWGWR